jgi:hypothetical protein
MRGSKTSNRKKVKHAMTMTQVQKTPPMQTAIQIGIVTLNIDTKREKDEEFYDAFDAGLQCYCECESDQRQLTVDQLIKMMKGVVTDDDGSGKKFPPQWHYGFILGWVTGLNNPEIINDDPSLSYTESVTRKHLPLYQDLVLQNVELTAEELAYLTKTAEEMERLIDTEPLPIVEPQHEEEA